MWYFNKKKLHIFLHGLELLFEIFKKRQSNQHDTELFEKLLTLTKQINIYTVW